MCQGDSVSGTREVKLLFSIFCSTSTFIWNYLLSLLSAAATGSNVQMFNETTNSSLFIAFFQTIFWDSSLYSQWSHDRQCSVPLLPTLSIFVVARTVRHSTCVPGRDEESWWGWENISDETIVDDDEWAETELIMMSTGLREISLCYSAQIRNYHNW